MSKRHRNDHATASFVLNALRSARGLPLGKSDFSERYGRQMKYSSIACAIVKLRRLGYPIGIRKGEGWYFAPTAPDWWAL